MVIDSLMVNDGQRWLTTDDLPATHKMGCNQGVAAGNREISPATITLGWGTRQLQAIGAISYVLSEWLVNNDHMTITRLLRHDHNKFCYHRICSY